MVGAEGIDCDTETITCMRSFTSDRFERKALIGNQARDKNESTLLWRIIG